MIVTHILMTNEGIALDKEFQPFQIVLPSDGKLEARYVGDYIVMQISPD